MIESRPAIAIAIMIISLASGTTQALKCFYCMDLPMATYPACRADTFDPNYRESVGVQSPYTPIRVTLYSLINTITLTSSDFNCSNACAIYTSASQSVIARSCYVLANIKAAYPDVQAQYCHTDYCNTSPMFPDTPPPSLPSGRQCYACFSSIRYGFTDCTDNYFKPAWIPYHRYGTYFEIEGIVIPPSYFDCSACQVVKIPSIGLTVRACSTKYNLDSLGYSDIQTQTCHSDYCNGYPLITDDNPKFLRCYMCIDAPQNYASNSNCSDPYFTRSDLPTQTPSAILEILGYYLNGNDFNCSTCATYKIPSLSLTLRSCYIKHNMTLHRYPDLTAQYCSTDYCNTGVALSRQLGPYMCIGLMLTAVLSMMFLS